jgi:hypothetical protein
MNSDLLRDHLAKLHEELGAASAVDPQSARLLAEIMNDINRLTANSAGGSAAAGSPAGRMSLPDRLEGIAAAFEAEHPTLAASARRLVDLLGKAGL